MIIVTLDSDPSYAHMGTNAADVTVFVDDMPTGACYAGYFVEAENNFGISGASDVERVFPTLRIGR